MSILTLNQLNISILSAQDGGLVVYEAVEGEQTLVFGGNLDEASKYLHSRMSKIVLSPDRPREIRPNAVREAPMSVALRRLEEVEVA